MIFKSKVVLAAFLLMGTTSIANAQDVSLIFSEPMYSGSGCPQDSVVMGSSPTAFTLLYDSFVVEDGNNVRSKENTKSCNVRVTITVPEGYQVSIDSVDHRGFVSLSSKRAWSFLKTKFRVKGSMWHAVGTSQGDYFRGPLDQDYFRRDAIRNVNKQWSPCGGSFNLDVDTYMHVHAARNESALMTLDASDGAMSTRFGTELRRCKS